MGQAKRFIFKNTVTEEIFVFPVTPSGYQISHGRRAVQVDMHGVGAINLPGEKTLLDETLTCFFPAHAYPFSQPEAGTNPFVPLETLEKWSDAGDPVRFLVSGTPVNALVLLDPITYGERDGTSDLYVTIPMRGYRILTAPETELSGTGNAARAVETEPAHATSYTVKAGDTLSEIAKWVYGDASLYDRLAAANDIANPDLIYVGQVLALPGVEALPAAESQTRSFQAAAKTSSKWTATGTGGSGVWKLQLKKEDAASLPAPTAGRTARTHPGRAAHKAAAFAP